MAQDLSTIIQGLDAGYAPSRQLIQSQIDALPDQEQSQEQGLQAQANQSYQDITNQARDKGMGFSGIPIQEQAQYNASSFLPAVANLKTSTNNTKTSLLDALNQSNLAEQNAGQSILQHQQDLDAQNAATAAANNQAAAQQASFGSLFSTPTAPAAPADPYASIDKNGANTAIKQLLSTNDPQLIGKTTQAISKSASNGNVYDQYKLELLNELQKDSSYGQLIGKAAPYTVATGTF